MIRAYDLRAGTIGRANASDRRITEKLTKYRFYTSIPIFGVRGYNDLAKVYTFGKATLDRELATGDCTKIPYVVRRFEHYGWLRNDNRGTV